MDVTALQVTTYFQNNQRTGSYHGPVFYFGWSIIIMDGGPRWDSNPIRSANALKNVGLHRRVGPPVSKDNLFIGNGGHGGIRTHDEAINPILP